MSESKNKETNPYVSAKNEWMERYGSYMKQAQNWRLTAFASLCIAGISVLGNIYMGSQSKITPYVIEVDKLGAVKTMGPAEKSSVTSQKLIKAQLISFIRDLRTITYDTVVQKQLMSNVYSFLPNRKQAFGVVTGLYKDENPFEVAKTKSRSIELVAVVPVSDTTYQIDWNDVELGVKGDEIGKFKKRAMITFIQKKQEDASEIYTNPLGIYIIELNVTNIN